MNKITSAILVLITIVTLSACGAAERAGATITGYSETCIKGVTYYQFTSGAVVGYDTNGAVLKCK